MSVELIFIGTLHGATSKKELEEVLEKYSPTQLLVEIEQEDIENNNLKKYPEEMIFAKEWAERNNILILGFDSGIKTTKEDFSEKDNKLLINKQLSLAEEKGLNWKDFNKEENLKLLEDIGSDAIVKEHDEKRNGEMLTNINNLTISEKKIVILTGSSHLKFFEKHFPNAKFPFR